MRAGGRRAGGLDSVKTNVAFEGGGTVWVKDVELLKAPLTS